MSAKKFSQMRVGFVEIVDGVVHMSCDAVKVGTSPHGGGIGVFAIRDLRAGEIILTEEAPLVSSQKSQRESLHMQLAKRVLQDDAREALLEQMAVIYPRSLDEVSTCRRMCVYKSWRTDNTPVRAYTGTRTRTHAHTHTLSLPPHTPTYDRTCIRACACMHGSVSVCVFYASVLVPVRVSVCSNGCVHGGICGCVRRGERERVCVRVCVCACLCMLVRVCCLCATIDS